ncbi:MAG TPA: YbaY family lipoprotein [Xanthomonadaceae bacterium]|nr:YbaY family lipoprotein [Xanthomonadaceae bacterium]
MRVALALTLALAVSACGQQAEPSGARSGAPDARQQAQPPVVSGPAVTGTINVPGLAQLPEGLQLNLKLLDLSDPTVTPPVVAETTTTGPRRLPHPFALGYPANGVSAQGRYGLEVALQAGGATLYGTPEPIGVLGAAPGSGVVATLVRGGQSRAGVDPGAQTRADFELLESKLGSMRRVTGERLDEAVAVGWDAFVDDTGVRVARENVELAEGGHAAYRYGYRDGRPWVVVRDSGGATTWVGWNPRGEVVLNQRGTDGPIEAEEAQRLYERAQRVLASIGRR